MSVTPYLGLALNGDTDTDKQMTFNAWRKSMNGTSGGSNMNLIDKAYGDMLAMFGGMAFAIDQTDNGVNIIYNTNE